MVAKRFLISAPSLDFSTVAQLPRVTLYSILVPTGISKLASYLPSVVGFSSKALGCHGPNSSMFPAIKSLDPDGVSAGTMTLQVTFAVAGFGVLVCLS
jgi:hypothetical protein